ncbi:MAG: hypothetical protein AB7U85_02205 [Alphaproteobacteria bacterium]
MTDAPEKEKDNNELSDDTSNFHSIVSKNALSLWGLENVSYVKFTVIEDKPVWGIYGAEGSLMTTANSRDAAFAIVKRFDLEPMSVH